MVSDAITVDLGLEAGFEESSPLLSVAVVGVLDFGKGFLTTGGGVERFLEFSKVAARALKAGDLPLTRTRSGLKDILLERCCCDFSGTAAVEDLPPYCPPVLLFGFFYSYQYIHVYKHKCT